MKQDTPHILVVDDSKINTSLLTNVLADYRVSAVFNGQSAIDRAHAERPDLILLDIQMPGMDGFEVCNLLKANPKTRDIPIIFITGMTEPENVTRGFTLGAVDYITKPFDFSEVKARVHTHLSLKTAREALERQNALLEETIRQQQIDISLARNIRQIINSPPPRHTPLAEDRSLFALATVMPCHAEGGDHSLILNLPATDTTPSRTLIALKDQSGHAVNCVLRSIITDLFHNSLICRANHASLEEMITRLNHTICQSALFAQDDFCTAAFVEIEHQSLTMRFISAGHPPIIVVRGQEIIPLPAPRQKGANLPLSVVEDLPYTAGSFDLAAGDRIIIYTDGLHAIPMDTGRDALNQNELNELIQKVAARNPKATVSRLIAGLLDDAASIGRDVPVPFTSNVYDDDISIIGLEVEYADDWQHESLVPARFPSVDEMIGHLCRRISLAANEAGHQPAMPQFEMALGEALLNALRHGHNDDLEKAIAVRWRIGNDLAIEIADQGPGFDPDAIPPPTRQNTVSRPSGRGIFIIRRYASEVGWSNGGRTLHLAFGNHQTSHLEENYNIFSSTFALWPRNVIQ